jgi:endonuclease III
MIDKRLERILKKLDETYGTEKIIYLEYNTPWQLLFATILSAQCTDARVNMVTRDLYKKYDSLEKFADADLSEMEKDIHSIGFYHNKAKNLIACARKLLTDFGGEVPSNLEDLLTLPGVGRKTANVIRGNIFDLPSIVVDTHVKRITKKLGFTESDDPVKIEFELMEILPKDHWIVWNTDLITLGRTICIARREKCDICFLRDDCPSAKV